MSGFPLDFGLNRVINLVRDDSDDSDEPEADDLNNSTGTLGN